MSSRQFGLTLFSPQSWGIYTRTCTQAPPTDPPRIAHNSDVLFLNSLSTTSCFVKGRYCRQVAQAHQSLLLLLLLLEGWTSSWYSGNPSQQHTPSRLYRNIRWVFVGCRGKRDLPLCSTPLLIQTTLITPLKSHPEIHLAEPSLSPTYHEPFFHLNKQRIKLYFLLFSSFIYLSLHPESDILLVMNNLLYVPLNLGKREKK